MHVACSAAAQVLHFRRDPQRAVLQFLVFLQQAHEGFVVAFDRTLGALWACFRLLVGVGWMFVVFVVAHRRPSILEVEPHIDV